MTAGPGMWNVSAGVAAALAADRRRQDGRHLPRPLVSVVAASKRRLDTGRAMFATRRRAGRTG